MTDVDPKLLKIIALAKHGIGGERDAALKIVKRICAEQNMEFDDVMNATDYREYVLEINFRNKFEEIIVGQTIMRFALTEHHTGVQINRKYKAFIYTTTPSKHIETANAAAVYLRAFRKERDKFMDEFAESFVHKHKLYSAVKDDGRKSQSTPSIEKQMRMMMIGNQMDDVQIHKSIGSGNAGN